MCRKLKAFSIPIPVKSWFHPESSNFSLSSSKASHLERGFRVKNSFLSLWSRPQEILLLLSFQLLFSSHRATTKQPPLWRLLKMTLMLPAPDSHWTGNSRVTVTLLGLLSSSTPQLLSCSTPSPSRAHLNSVCLLPPLPHPPNKPDRSLPTSSKLQMSFWGPSLLPQGSRIQNANTYHSHDKCESIQEPSALGSTVPPWLWFYWESGKSWEPALGLCSSGSYQVCFMRILKPSGQVEGTGRCRLLLPTPQMMAEESTSL